MKFGNRTQECILIHLVGTIIYSVPFILIDPGSAKCIDFWMNRINRDAINDGPYRINVPSGERHVTDLVW
jgi:hypothetical protein